MKTYNLYQRDALMSKAQGKLVYRFIAENLTREEIVAQYDLGGFGEKMIDLAPGMMMLDTENAKTYNQGADKSIILDFPRA